MPPAAIKQNRWQELAAEALAAAERMYDPKTRAILIEIARGYERLGKRAGTLHASVKTEP